MEDDSTCVLKANCNLESTQTDRSYRQYYQRFTTEFYVQIWTVNRPKPAFKKRVNMAIPAWCAQRTQEITLQVWKSVSVLSLFLTFDRNRGHEKTGISQAYLNFYDRSSLSKYVVLHPFQTYAWEPTELGRKSCVRCKTNFRTGHRGRSAGNCTGEQQHSGAGNAALLQSYCWHANQLAFY